MNFDEFNKLERGDIVRHKDGGISYVVDNNFFSYAVAMASAYISNPSEWVLVLKANHKRPERRVDEKLDAILKTMPKCNCGETHLFDQPTGNASWYCPVHGLKTAGPFMDKPGG